MTKNNSNKKTIKYLDRSLYSSLYRSLYSSLVASILRKLEDNT